jgi:hypothetical protein
VLTINYHVALKAQTLEKFGLSFRASFCHFNNSLWLNSFNSCFELVYLNFDKLSFAFDFELKFIFGKFYFVFILLFNKFEVSIFFNTLGIYEELSLIDFGLCLDKVGLSFCAGICDCETS